MIDSKMVPWFTPYRFWTANTTIHVMSYSNLMTENNVLLLIHIEGFRTSMSLELLVLSRNFEPIEKKVVLYTYVPNRPKQSLSL